MNPEPELEPRSARAPGRINLIGEHLDYNGGRCLPIAIAASTAATVGPGLPDQVRIISRSLDGDRSWSGVCSQYGEGWAAYVTGVLWALGVHESLDIEITSEVPIGAGLASSAALECSVALAVDAYLGLGLSRDELVLACVRAENEYVGVPTGGMDQACSVFAEPGHAVLLDFSDGSRSSVRFDPPGLTLLVVDTGVRHRLDDGQYADRRTECGRAARLLGVRRLLDRTGPDDAWERLEDDVLRRRVRHVLTEQRRVDDFLAVVGAGDWAAAGAVMSASHRSLRDDFEVSCAALDMVVDTALDLGALGARMTGAGFGGSAIALVPTPSEADVVAGIRAAFAAEDWNAPTVFAVEASRGAEVLRST